MSNARASLPSRIIAAACGRFPPVPVDLPALALQLGVDEVRGVHSISGYRTDFSGAAPTVYLGRSRTAVRDRFVFAHELAHVMLQDREALSGVIGERVRGAILAQEERWADAIAGTLLAPDADIDVLGSAPLSWPRLQSAASRLQVSHTLLVTRLSMTGHAAALMLLENVNGGWIVTSRTNTPRDLLGRLFVEASCTSALTAVNAQARNVEVVLVKADDRRWILNGHARLARGAVHVLFRGADDVMPAPPQPSRSRWPAHARRAASDSLR